MSTVFWIAVGAAVAAACLGSRKGTGTVSSGGQKTPFRIDHLRCGEADEYECSACGARFKQAGMICPRCGTHFTGIREDSTEFEEEMMEEEEWDEEEGL